MSVTLHEFSQKENHRMTKLIGFPGFKGSKKNT